MPTSPPHVQPRPRSEGELGEPRASDRARHPGKLLLIAALCLLLGYAGGLLHGTLRARSAAQGLEAELSESNQRLGSALEQVASERRARTQLSDVIDLYEADRAIAQALRALDSRNFGTAESHVRASEARLRELSDAMPRLKGLHNSVAQINVKVADDLAAQRSALLELVVKLDENLRVARGDLKLTRSRSAAERPRE